MPTRGSSKKPDLSSPSDDALEEYRKKRDPLRTNEPFAPERKDSARSTRQGRFVVHLHDATNTHYDLRLQVGGTLKSFAVPKGPSLDPSQKRLAVLTEDHPLEYLDFEEVIPEGNYGAGSMIAWDLGRVVYLDGTAEEGIARGKIDFTLSGFKLQGRFGLIETGRRKDSKASGKQWLLVKKPDIHKSERDLLVEEPRSVLSGLAIEELERRAEIAAELTGRAAALGAPAGDVATGELTPMLCALEGARLDDPERLYELKLDGVRIIADKRERAVALRYRHGRPATATYPEIARAIATLAPGRVVLDGEIIAYDAEGRPSFAKLGPRMHAERPLEVQRAQAAIPVSYLAFDILQLGERDLRGLPLVERKRLLSEVVRGRGLVRALDHLDGDGTTLFSFCREQHLEGVVAKRKSSPYRSGPRRTDDWVKVKCERDDEFVVVGWVAGRGVRERLGALCLASYGPKGLTYRGRVGSGLDDATIEELVPKLAALATDSFQGPTKPPAEADDSHWVRPELVVSVRYLGWTPEHHLRHPVFRGVRNDIEAAACHAMPPEEQIELEALPETEGDAGDGLATAEEREREVVRTTPSARVTISNRDKVFWPDEGYTKGDLINYYASVSPAMLPFLRERPVVMVRYPDGWKGKSFYQWNVPQGTPDWLRRATLRDEEKDKEKTVFLLDDVDALVYLANLGTIPLHVLACREETRHSADFLTIDFDIGEHPFERAVVLARTLREFLDEIGLVGYPKTSGQKGLHVLVALGPGIGFETSKLLCEFLGRLVTARHPKIATMERRVDQRGGRALVDVGQTGTSRTIVAPYSVRAYPGATVSTPLHWDEVHVALDPRRFTLVTVPARLAEVGDLFRGLLDERPDVPSAVEKLGALAAASAEKSEGRCKRLRRKRARRDELPHRDAVPSSPRPASSGLLFATFVAGSLNGGKPMASLSKSDLGLGPSAPDNEGRRARRYVEYADESGARPLPTGAYEPYDVDPLDEEVVLPGVGRPQAGMFFGIGVGLGIAVLAVVAGLYLGGYVGRPALGPSPEPSSLEPNLLAFEDAQNAEALALARIALAPRALTPTQTESPDIQMIVEPTSSPTQSSEPQPAAPEAQSQRPSGLSNELDQLQQSLPPRGPVAPRPPTDEQAAPESPPLPPPAEPTAPAEMSAPDTIPPPTRNP